MVIFQPILSSGLKFLSQIQETQESHIQREVESSEERKIYIILAEALLVNRKRGEKIEGSDMHQIVSKSDQYRFQHIVFFLSTTKW